MELSCVTVENIISEKGYVRDQDALIVGDRQPENLSRSSMQMTTHAPEATGDVRHDNQFKTINLLERPRASLPVVRNFVFSVENSTTELVTKQGDSGIEEGMVHYSNTEPIKPYFVNPLCRLKAHRTLGEYTTESLDPKHPSPLPSFWNKSSKEEITTNFKLNYVQKGKQGDQNDPALASLSNKESIQNDGVSTTKVSPLQITHGNGLTSAKQHRKESRVETLSSQANHTIDELDNALSIELVYPDSSNGKMCKRDARMESGEIEPLHNPLPLPDVCIFQSLSSSLKCLSSTSSRLALVEICGQTQKKFVRDNTSCIDTPLSGTNPLFCRSTCTIAVPDFESESGAAESQFSVAESMTTDALIDVFTTCESFAVSDKLIEDTDNSRLLPPPYHPRTRSVNNVESMTSASARMSLSCRLASVVSNRNTMSTMPSATKSFASIRLLKKNEGAVDGDISRVLSRHCSSLSSLQNRKEVGDCVTLFHSLDGKRSTCSDLNRGSLLGINSTLNARENANAKALQVYLNDPDAPHFVRPPDARFVRI